MILWAGSTPRNDTGTGETEFDGVAEYHFPKDQDQNVSASRRDAVSFRIKSHPTRPESEALRRTGLAGGNGACELEITSNTGETKRSFTVAGVAMVGDWYALDGHQTAFYLNGTKPDWQGQVSEDGDESGTATLLLRDP